MKDRVILISKDVLMRNYLSIYGNQHNKTPNIDELAAKGTVFMKHYTAAPSTAMSFTSMFTGLYAYETDRSKYVEVSEYKDDTLFDKLHDRGYACHVVWDASYVHLAQKYSKCYGRDTEIHNTDFLTRKQPAHVKGKFDDMSFDKELEKKCLQQTEKLVNELCEKNDKLFLWIHFPHALLGRNSYGSDIDMLDRMVGLFRKYFDDDSIYITADHGHMNGSHGKYGYGFDVNENAIQIPFITPRLNNCKIIDFPTSNTQLEKIIMQGIVEQHETILSETAYYMQPHRKIAIIHNQYKYIYDKMTKKEYLYDIQWDQEENINLIYPEIYDTDRKINYSLSQRFFYPNWTDIEKEYRYLKKKVCDIWKNAPWYIELKERILMRIKMLYTRIKK